MTARFLFLLIVTSRLATQCSARKWIPTFAVTLTYGASLVPRFAIALLGCRPSTSPARENWRYSIIHSGPYRAIIKTINNISEEYPNSSGKIWGHYYLTHPKAKEPQYIRGIHYGGIPITDDMKFDLKLAVRSNNQWKRNAFVGKFNRACSSILSMAPWFPATFYEPDSKCPLPKVGAKVIKNQTFTPVLPDYPILPYNRYLFTCAIYEEGALVGLIVADTDIVPKL